MHVNIDISIPSRNITKIIDEHTRNISSIQSTIDYNKNSHIEA